MFNRTTLLLRSACVAIAAGLGLAGAQAEDTVKIGFILPLGRHSRRQDGRSTGGASSSICSIMATLSPARRSS